MRFEDFLAGRRRPFSLVVLAVACFAVCSLSVSAVAAEAKPAGSFQIAAWTFDRGNGKTIYNPDIYADYRDKYPELVVGGGELPWSIEYDINFPVDATYTIQVQYASPGQRPVEVWLDDKKIGTCCGRITGNAAPYPDRHPPHNRPRYEDGVHGLEWEEGCKLPAKAGKQTLKFTCQGPPPNLSALRIESPVAFPKEWKLDNREVNLDRMQANCRRLFLPPGAVNIAALQLAVEDMNEEFGPQYPKGPQYLKQLAELEAQQAAAKDAAPEQKQKIEDALQSLQRDAMLSHPALKFDKLLFLKRHYVGSSIYTDHGARSSGGNLCVLSPVSPSGKVTELVPELAGGRFGGFDLSFDATKIVFCCTKSGRFRIYEIDIDPKTGLRVPGKSLRQLTFDTEKEAETMRLYKGSFCGVGYDDVDPCYLPNGKIMFVSTRAHRAVLCRGVTATTLHLMDGDGKNIRCISGGQVNELAPSLLDDGRVAYPRWEYVDKGFANAVSLWAVHPDGGGSDHVYKNMAVLPCALIDVRSIPGSRRLITVGAGHHLGLDGPVVIVDNRHNRRTPKGMTNLTPEISYPGMYPMPGKSGAGRFRHPYPFSEKFFLIAHNAPPVGEAKRFSLHAIDAWGNRAELYGDPEISCFQPVPLRPRTRPTEIPSVARRYGEWGERKAESGKNPKSPNPQIPSPQATLFLRDVYQGLTGVERGRVKYIRVMEAQILPWEDAYMAEGGPGQQMSVVS